MRAVPQSELPYRDFYYPLNVFMHILAHEEGGAKYLHYGLFENENEPIAAAQEHSTELLLQRLPSPPATILEVGAGLGTTLARLTALGYDATGITPDEKQIGFIRARYGDALRLEQVSFEHFTPRPFDMVVFQESAQYIDATALFGKARELTRKVLVLDEFSTRRGETLHGFENFIYAADQAGFTKREDLDVSTKAAPTVRYFMNRIPRYRDVLLRDLGLTPEQLDDLIASGEKYLALYATGVYVYKLLRFERIR